VWEYKEDVEESPEQKVRDDREMEFEDLLAE
jgi:hypothetical protein